MNYGYSINSMIDLILGIDAFVLYAHLEQINVGDLIRDGLFFFVYSPIFLPLVLHSRSSFCFLSRSLLLSSIALFHSLLHFVFKSAPDNGLC